MERLASVVLTERFVRGKLMPKYLRWSLESRFAARNRDEEDEHTKVQK
jgi:hypothetical protein